MVLKYKIYTFFYLKNSSTSFEYTDISVLSNFWFYEIFLLINLFNRIYSIFIIFLNKILKYFCFLKIYYYYKKFAMLFDKISSKFFINV